MTVPRDRERWLRLGGLLISAALLAALGVALAGRVDDLRAAGGLPAPAGVAAAVAINLLANVLLADTWRQTMRLSGAPIPARRALWLWSSSQIVRYIVSLGQVGGRAIATARAGYGGTAAGVTAAVELLLFLTTSAVLVLLTLPAWSPGDAVPGWLGLAAALPLLGVVVAIARPAVVLRLLRAAVQGRLVPGLLRRRLQPLLAPIELTSADVALLVGRHGLNALLRLLAFGIVLASTGAAVTDAVPTVVGAYAVGTFVGFVVIIAPGGLGVREGTTTLLLTPVFGAGPSLVAVAAIRLSELVAEALLLAVARLLRGEEDGPRGEDSP